MSPSKLRVVALRLHHKNCLDPASHSRARSPRGHSWDAMSTRDPPKGVSPAGRYSTGQAAQRASSQNKGICENSSRQISNASRRRVLFKTPNPAEKENEGRNPKVHQRRAVLRMEPTEASKPGWSLGGERGGSGGRIPILPYCSERSTQPQLRAQSHHHGKKQTHNPPSGSKSKHACCRPSE